MYLVLLPYTLICPQSGRHTFDFVHTTLVFCYKGNPQLKHCAKMDFRIRQKHNRQGTSKPTKLNTANYVPSAIGRILKRRWTVLSPNGRRWNAQHQTRNGQLCSRSYTTQPRHILESQREKHQDWFDPNDQELQTLMRGRSQAHQTDSNHG